MTNQSSGPSAEQVAEELVRQTSVQRMRYAEPDIYTAYTEAKSRERGRLLVSSIVLYVIAAPIVIPLIYYVFFATTPEFMRPGIFEFFIFSGFMLVIIYAFLKSRFDPDSVSTKLLQNFERRHVTREMRMPQDIEDVKKRIEDESFARGTNIVANGGSVVIVDSEVVSSTIQTLSNSAGDKEIANALTTIAGFVEKSGNTAAKEPFENLVDAVKQKKPSQIRAFWKDLVDILPDIKDLTVAAAAITKLFL